MEKIILSIIDDLNMAIPSIVAIYQYGSFGTALETKDSDIDIAILPQKPIDQLFLWELSQKIANCLNRDVELVDLSQASTVFQTEILTTGVCIFSSNEKERENLENLYLSMYIRLNDQRSSIIEDQRHTRGKSNG